MSGPNDLTAIYITISMSRLAVEEAHSKCQSQFVRLYNQRQTLRANRVKRLARQAKQKEELRALYSSLGLDHTGE